MPSNPKSLGNRIRELRIRLGLSQAALAKRIGVSTGAVGQWEIGATGPKRAIVEALAHELGVSSADLMGSDTPPPPALREPTELEMVAWTVERSNIAPARKPALLGLLKDFLEEERLALVMAVINAPKADLATMTENLADFLPAKGNDARERGAR